jgi:hypothetical protein
MRLSRPEKQAGDDLFSPLRDLRSPVSMEKLKTIVFDRASINFSLWSQIRGLLGEFLALGVLSATIINFSGFRAPGLVERGNNTSTVTSSSELSVPTVNSILSPKTSFNHSNTHDPLAPRSLTDKIVSESTDQVMPITPLRMENIASVIPRNNEIKNYLQTSSSDQNTSESTEWYSTVSGGAVFSHIRMMGENAEIGIQRGWESIGLSVSNANGNRDMHDVLAHHSTESSLVFSENDQAIALMAGANFSVGSFAGKIEAGPAYLFSSTTNVDPATMALGQVNSSRRIGMVTEVSAFYNVSGFLQTGLSCVTTFQAGQFSNEILFSINIRP